MTEAAPAIARRAACGARLLLPVFMVGCAAAPPPPARSSGPAEPRVQAEAARPAAAAPPPAPSPPPQTAPGDVDAPAPPPEAAPADRPLAWVNPARCLPSCDQHPGAALVRVNERAEADPRGAHRVDAGALPALRGLLAAAREAGHTLRIASAFRAYAEQARLFRSVKEQGRAARPGHSEHQLGTAIDLRLPTSAAIAWLAAQAPAHGFVLSYPPGKQRLTGYRPEPWHVRYVGPHLAGELARRGWTLEELFRDRPALGQSGACDDCPSATSRARCGAVSQQGGCRGTVLVWCYDGALAAVDCGVSNQTCGPAPDGGGAFDCLPP